MHWIRTRRKERNSARFVSLGDVQKKKGRRNRASITHVSFDPWCFCTPSVRIQKENRYRWNILLFRWDPWWCRFGWNKDTKNPLGSIPNKKEKERGLKRGLVWVEWNAMVRWVGYETNEVPSHPSTKVSNLLQRRSGTRTKSCERRLDRFVVSYGIFSSGWVPNMETGRKRCTWDVHEEREEGRSKFDPSIAFLSIVRWFFRSFLSRFFCLVSVRDPKRGRSSKIKHHGFVHPSICRDDIDGRRDDERDSCRLPRKVDAS